MEEPREESRDLSVLLGIQYRTSNRRIYSDFIVILSENLSLRLKALVCRRPCSIVGKQPPSLQRSGGKQGPEA